MKLIRLVFLIVGFLCFNHFDSFCQDVPPKVLAPKKNHLPTRASFGVEVSRHFELGLYNIDNPDQQDLKVDNNFEFGANYLFTSWIGKYRPVENKGALAKNFGMFQVGPFITANPVKSVLVSPSNSSLFSLRKFDELVDPMASDSVPQPASNLWKYSLGIMYNQINTEVAGLGFSFRVKGTTYTYSYKDEDGFDPDNSIETGNLFENIDLTAQAGITFLSIINVYYGITFPIVEKQIELPGAPQTPLFDRHTEQRITLTINLNPSLFKFALQGL